MHCFMTLECLRWSLWYLAADFCKTVNIINIFFKEARPGSIFLNTPPLEEAGLIPTINSSLPSYHFPSIYGQPAWAPVCNQFLHLYVEIHHHLVTEV